MALTLPIVVGKKYVRRDGKVITAEERNKFVTVFAEGEPRTRYPFSCMAFPSTGRINDEGEHDTDRDLVADYIEPAKGHPHAEERCYGFKTGVTYVFTKPLTIPCGGLTAEQVDEHIARGFGYEMLPDPHAKVAAEYAKDMAVSNCAWEGWEVRGLITNSWVPLMGHPKWEPELTFRRKGSL